MTFAELGAQLKLVHPEYKDVPDRELGMALQRKYPDFYQADAGDDVADAAPSKLAGKMADIQSGVRKVVFVARGTKDKVNAADFGLKRVTLPSGDYFYDPKVIRPQEIMAAIRDHEVGDLIAPVAQPEAEAEPMDAEVPQGEELQQQIDSAGDAGPAAPTDIPDVQNQIAAASKRRGDKWPKPKGPVKLPIGESQ